MAIIRVEQVAPFPSSDLKKIIMKYKNAKFIWSQEEHQNYGAWSYINPRIRLVFYLKLI